MNYDIKERKRVIINLLIINNKEQKDEKERNINLDIIQSVAIFFVIVVNFS